MKKRRNGLSELAGCLFWIPPLFVFNAKKLMVLSWVYLGSSHAARAFSPLVIQKPTSEINFVGFLFQLGQTRILAIGGYGTRPHQNLLRTVRTFIKDHLPHLDANRLDEKSTWQYAGEFGMERRDSDLEGEVDLDVITVSDTSGFVFRKIGQIENAHENFIKFLADIENLELVLCDLNECRSAHLRLGSDIVIVPDGKHVHKKINYDPRHQIASAILAVKLALDGSRILHERLSRNSLTEDKIKSAQTSLKIMETRFSQGLTKISDFYQLSVEDNTWHWIESRPQKQQSDLLKIWQALEKIHDFSQGNAPTLGRFKQLSPNPLNDIMILNESLLDELEMNDIHIIILKQDTEIKYYKGKRLLSINKIENK